MRKQLSAAMIAIAFTTPTAWAESIVDTVSVAEREWAQIDLFKGTSGDEISRVCPAGNCDAGTGETLAGWNMSGWTWASQSDVETLLTTLTPYTGNNTEFSSTDGTWAADFFDKHGFRPTVTSDAGRGMLGRTSTATDMYRDVTAALSHFNDPALADVITMKYWTPHHYPYATTGAFFYRDKAGE